MNVPPSQPPGDPDFRDHPGADEISVQELHQPVVREFEEPRDGYEPVSTWLIVLIWALALWAGLYLAFHSGGFRADVFDPNRVAWDGGGAAAGPATVDPLVVGRQIFAKNCVVCHQGTGQGVSGVFPPLAGSEWVLGGDWQRDSHLVKVVLHGLQGPVTVKGATYNSAMVPWGGTLDDAEVASVLTYIRSEWGNSAPPISPEFVAEVRKEHSDRKDSWTEKELRAQDGRNDKPAAAAGAPSGPSEKG